ncbi:MAG: lysophospholipid acyltransferase family protein [bacterium]
MGKKIKPEAKFRDLISYWLVLSLMKVVHFFPFSASCRMGEFAGTVWFYLDRRHRAITLDNLKRAFGRELSEAQQVDLARKTYRTLGRVLMECISLPSLTAEALRDYVSISGLRHLREAQKQGKGILILTAHFGNWELLALAFNLYGFRSSAVARPLDNPYLDRLVKSIRSKYGNQLISKKGAVKEIIRCLAQKGMVGVLIDQNVSSREGVFVDFFGTPASTTPVLAALSQKTGAPVLPIFMVPRKRDNGMGENGYVIKIGKPVTLINTGEKERDLIVNTARFTHIIEEHIRAYPHCWFWMHRRWKIRPEDQLQEWGKIRQAGEQ